MFLIGVGGCERNWKNPEPSVQYHAMLTGKYDIIKEKHRDNDLSNEQMYNFNLAKYLFEEKHNKICDQDEAENFGRFSNSWTFKSLCYFRSEMLSKETRL